MSSEKLYRAKVFFGYPSKPDTLRETILTASKSISKSQEVDIQSWEDLKVSGRVVIATILAAIDSSDLCAFDVTFLNQNVMFELGYAIGANKRIWLLRDYTVKEEFKFWKRVQFFSPIGFEEYNNSDHVASMFATSRPHEAATTLFQDLLEPSFEPRTHPQVFYMRSNNETEADRRLLRRIEVERKEGVKVMVDDASESHVQPLSWYARQIYGSQIVIAHLSSQFRREADIHNARASFICGMAVALKQQVLMMCEIGLEEALVPVDYQHLAFTYRNAKECTDMADSWLLSNMGSIYSKVDRRSGSATGQVLKTELRGLKLGEYVAENEEDELSNYFVDTTSFNEVLERKTTVFVGSKGTGKTANMFQAAETLSSDKRNLVVLIKPGGYELSNLLSLLRRFSSMDSKGYLVESLWKYLLYTEIAWAASKMRPPDTVEPGSPLWNLQQHMKRNSGGLHQDFAVRLERAVLSLEKVKSEKSLESAQIAISEALHDGVLKELRSLLGEVLHEKKRVAVLIDNLDKAWEKGSDLDTLSEMLLGLLTTIGKLTIDFKKSDSWRQSIDISLAVFIRSDIYNRLSAIAREPDKIPTSRLAWNDPEMLLRVIEERFVASRGGKSEPADLWVKFFCSHVNSMSTKDYISKRVLPRPRDIVYLCSAAVSNAINRNHKQVEGSDIIDAEATYSQFAFEALQVSNGVTWSDLEKVLYEFVGGKAIVTETEVCEFLGKAGVPAWALAPVLNHLCSVSFLGQEIKDDHFEYTDDPRLQPRNDAASRKLAETRKLPRRFQVHAAFRPFLAIED